MTTMYYGPSLIYKFKQKLHRCLEEWHDDPAFNAAAQKLREVDRELEVLIESPGHRAAARAAEDNSSGQKASRRTLKGA